MTEQKTKQKTVQKTVQKTTHGTLHKTGSWLWVHRDYVAHYAMVACGVMLMVGGANKLVFGRIFPK